MAIGMTKAEAQAWKARWEAVNEFEREELATIPLDVKLRQLTTLMGWVKTFGWKDALSEGEAEVRARWLRLKGFYRG